MPNSIEKTDREKLSGFFRFAQGVLAARDQVILRMRDTGLGCFLESEIDGLPGLAFNVDEEKWLVLQRLRESHPPLPEAMLADWLDGRINDPGTPPRFKPVIVRDVEIEEASDLCEAELLDIDDVHARSEEASEGEVKTGSGELVKIALRLERVHEIRAGLEEWRNSAWETWALDERPVRKSIRLYNKLFKLHNMLHGGVAATPPELVWGMGLARWKRAAEVIDMPLIEQLVDLEVQAQGALVIRPRDVRPCVVMKPFLHLGVAGSGVTQREVAALFQGITDGSDQEISPFDAGGWENVLDLAARRLSSRGRHVTMEALREGAEVKAPETDLAVYSTWAIYGRARSENIREQDLERLREKLDKTEDDSDLPASMRGYVVPAPEMPQEPGDDWGLTRSLSGETPSGWNGAGHSAGTGMGKGRNIRASSDRQGKDYYFPLPYNEEQAQIIDRLDSPEVQVVSVTGPPGTGKTHSIANIIGHFMATGRRVLVTARTSEAIAAVRDKLPPELASLVIASVASDREGTKQMEDAIQRLSDDVVSLSKNETREEIGRFEAQIGHIDAESRRCDQRLAQVAEQNFTPLTWAGEKCTVMKMAEILAKLEPVHGWMADRPARSPPEGLNGVIERLRDALQRLDEDLVYLGVKIPEPSEIPFAKELIKAHESERAHRGRPREDFSGEPTMARDTPDVEVIAVACHDSLSRLRETLADSAQWERSLAGALIQAGLNERPKPITEECVESLWTLIGEGKLSPGRITYRVEGYDLEPLLQAAARGQRGKPPVPRISRLFDSKLVEAVESIRIDGVEPNGEYQWAMVYDALKIAEAWGAIDGYWLAEADAGRLPPMPELPEHADELVSLVKKMKARIPVLREAAAQALAQAESLKRLFPYGLAVDECLAALEIERILRALRANMKDAYIPPAAIAKLESIAARGEGPLFKSIGALRELLGSDDLGDGEIVPKRNAITEEIVRLQGLVEDLAAVECDLQALREAGAQQWAAACLQSPQEAPSLLPDSWRESWDWAVMKERIDQIIALGNGDDWREKKIQLARQRESSFEQLIRARTLLGLKQRLSGQVQTALATFTNGIRRLGKGTGKSAGRWRTAIRKAAMEAAPAVPVWVMPEHKIAEQLAPKLADFDLVILDEASQSDVTAIAALARGKKHLIVGDEQQVSPAAVGIPQNKIDVLRAEFLESLPNKNVIDAGTSIFEVAMQMFPHNHQILREHFRCVEPIIQFSTRFYSGRLIPLRVSKASERFDPPLVDVFVKGGERRGKTNQDEARFIVDEIAAIAKNPDHAWRDVAVISLIGGEQAELIERELMEDPRVGTEIMERMRIVCGDSRTMQGQERSIVFLSMVATPETAILQNTQEAKQRFNVALSRARDRLYLVRSVSREDLKPGDLKRAVIEYFADPMPEGRAYAGQSVLDRCDSGFEREVCRLLIDANYRVRSQVKVGPFSIDLVAEGADDRRLAIELDGDAWHGPEKWDQDMSRQAKLERAGWTFWRVFGSQWISNPEYWWNHLMERLRVMGIEPIGAETIDDVFTENRVFDVSVGSEVCPDTDAAQRSAAGDDEASAADVWQAEVSKPALDPGVTDGQEPSNEGAQGGEYHRTQASGGVEASAAQGALELEPVIRLTPQRAKEPVLGEGKTPVSHEPDPSRFYDDSYQETLRSIVWGLVDSEGPISSQFLFACVARLHVFQRTGSRIKETIQRALKGTRELSHGKGDDAVLWPKDLAIKEWVEFRGLTLQGRKRHWADVPMPEKLGLARMIVAESVPDPENAMRDKMEMTRLKASTRIEIKHLLEKARVQLAAEGRESVQRPSNVSYLNQRRR